MQKFLDISGLARLWAKIKAVMPSKTSDLINDSGFVASATDQLVHYYKKSQTYSQDEVDYLLGVASDFDYVSVVSLPTASASTKGKFYLYNGHRWITTGNDPYEWVDLGTYDVNLAGYVSEAALALALANRPEFEQVTEEQMQSLIDEETWEQGKLYYTVEE